MTACRTRLSSGFRLGSLVDERMPVPQLLARVLLAREVKNGVRTWASASHTDLCRTPKPGRGRSQVP